MIDFGLLQPAVEAWTGIVQVCNLIWDALNTPLYDFIQSFLTQGVVGDFLSWLLDLLPNNPLTELLNNYTLLSLFLGPGLIVILIYNLFKWIIPI